MEYVIRKILLWTDVKQGLEYWQGMIPTIPYTSFMQSHSGDGTERLFLGQTEAQSFVRGAVCRDNSDDLLGYRNGL